MEIRGLTKAQVDLAFRQHRRGQLRDWALLPFGQKMEMVEEMDEVAEVFARSRAQRAALVAERPPTLPRSEA